MGMGVSVREGQRMYECVGEQNVRRRPLGLQTIDRVGVVVCVWYEYMNYTHFVIEFIPLLVAHVVVVVVDDDAFSTHPQ